MRTIWIASAIILTLAFTCLAVSQVDLERCNTVIDSSLKQMGIEPQGISIRSDYAKPDRFRIPLIDSLMAQPTSLLSRVDSLARDLESKTTMSQAASLLFRSMGIPVASLPVRPASTPRIKDVYGKFRHLPKPLQDVLLSYLRRLEFIKALRDSMISGCQTDLLFQRGPFLVIPHADYENVGPFELYEIEKTEEALTDSVLKASEAIDLSALAQMTVENIVLAENVSQRLKTEVGKLHARWSGAPIKIRFGKETSVVYGEIVYAGKTSFGPIVIGGPMSNTYEGCFCAIVESNGDDIYRLSHSKQVPFRLIVDYSGNDLYESPDSLGVAAAILGCSILIDYSGDDTYYGNHASLGSAIYGGSVLLDKSGDDVYSSGGFSQGAGFLGVGILCDCQGNDTYISEMQSQGFGYVMGSGLLLDRDGNDTYHTQMSRKDILRYEDHFLTLSQGCGFGSRPDYSGGIGLLIDQSGNDLYSSDIFGQGVAYWFALGALIDRSGHDKYCSYQYAQGSGVHLAFGLLIDEEGNDFYQSKGVSQGCGHDLSLGLLADFSGNDCYTATDLSQGAGNANGIGILYDADGIDSYSSKSEVNVNGYGNYRRDFGSIGLHIDLRGRDFYSARGSDANLWESGKYGLGIDYPKEASRRRGDIKVSEYPFEEGDYTPEQLFILASRGEPRFSQWRKFAFEEMVRDSAATVNYLSTRLDTKDARERHTIKDILHKIGEPAVPMLCEAVLTANDRAKAEASWILGLIGSSRAFDALLELTVSDNWKLRTSAFGSLGKLKGLSDNEKQKLEARITEVLSSPEEVFYVRKAAAYAAGEQALGGVIPLLFDCITDQHYSVRYAACESLRKLSAEHSAEILDEYLSRMSDFTPQGLVAAIYACGNLPPDQRLVLIERTLEFAPSPKTEVAVALGKLVESLAGEIPQSRIQNLIERLPMDRWELKAILNREYSR